ncbi:MAG: saccharopine dehydrogenase (NAD+, L-glutamate forming), partial [Nonlabens sp.]
MRNILIIGAGKSTGVLVDYLLNKSDEHQLQLLIADKNLQSAESLSQNHENATAIELDIFEPEQRREQIQKADIVISMLPARFHIEVAKDCVSFNKNLVTASYVSPEMESLDKEVKEKGLVFMNEIGVDPGVDHMSAMQIIDRITNQGGKILLFESFTGGLVAP